MTTWTDDEVGGSVWSEDEAAGTALGAATGSSLVGFIQSGTGAIARTVQAKAREIVSLTDYGGVGDSGTTDNGVAFQKAHDALGADGGIIYIPSVAAGYYGVTTQAAFTKDIEFWGGGVHCSEIASSTASLVWFTHTARFLARSVGFTALGSAINSCTFVKCLSAASNHGDSGLYDCFMSGADRCYWSQRTNKIQIHNCTIAGAYGLYLENTTSSDEGDSFVTNNSISCTTTGIHVASTSGLYLSNNKFNGACPVHVDVAPTTNAVGNFTITGGSFEGHTTAGVRLIATSGSIDKTLITGVQFSSGSATHVIVGKTARHTNISGCTFNDTNAANGIGIDLQADSLNTTITGNEFYQINIAIQSDADILGETIKSNRFGSDVTTIYSGEDSAALVGTAPSDKELVFSKFLSVSSNASYTNSCKVNGQCVVEVTVDGVVQGAGNAQKYRKVMVSEATVTDIIAEVTTGQVFDLQIADDGGGYAAIGIKRNGATGTSVTAFVTVKVTGYPTEFLKV